MSSDRITEEKVENPDNIEQVEDYCSQIDEEKSRTLAVVRAFIANIGIALVKLICFFFSHSSAMLSEAIHSGVDSFNSVCL